MILIIIMMMMLMMILMMINSQSLPAKQSECLCLQVSGSRLHWKNDQVHWTETRVIMIMMKMKKMTMIVVSKIWYTGKVSVGGELRIAHFLALFPPPRQGLEFLSPPIHQPDRQLMILRQTKRRQDPDRLRAAAHKSWNGGGSDSWTWSRSKVGGGRKWNRCLHPPNLQGRSDRLPQKVLKGGKRIAATFDISDIVNYSHLKRHKMWNLSCIPIPPPCRWDHWYVDLCALSCYLHGGRGELITTAGSDEKTTLVRRCRRCKTKCRQAVLLAPPSCSPLPCFHFSLGSFQWSWCWCFCWYCW